MNAACRALSACILVLTIVVTGCNPAPKATDVEVRWETSQQTYSASVPAAYVSALRDYLPIAFKWSRRPLRIYIHMEKETSCRSKYMSMLEMAVQEFDHNIPGRFIVTTSPSDPDVVIDVSRTRPETLLTPRRLLWTTLKYLDDRPIAHINRRSIFYEPNSLSIVFGYVQDTTTCEILEGGRHNTQLHNQLLSYMAYFIEPRSDDQNADRRLSGFDIKDHLLKQTAVVGTDSLLHAKLVDSLTRH